MRKVVYESIINLARNFEDQAALNGIRAAIADGNQDNLCLTMKCYRTETGLSNLVHSTASGSQLAQGVSFRVKGPMGKGIDAPRRGKCIAITGGTGILVFIDLVAHLILRIISANGGPDFFEEVDADTMINLDEFSLDLYTSFSSPTESIAIDLVTCLKELCLKHNLPKLFKHCKALESLN